MQTLDLISATKINVRLPSLVKEPRGIGLVDQKTRHSTRGNHQEHATSRMASPADDLPENRIAVLEILEQPPIQLLIPKIGLCFLECESACRRSDQTRCSTTPKLET